MGRATAALADVRDDDIVTTPVGGMGVPDWLPTPTFELAVHGMDIGTAAGVSFELPEPVPSEAATLAARIAVSAGRGLGLRRAMTGRGTLPAGFTAV